MKTVPNASPHIGVSSTLSPTTTALMSKTLDYPHPNGPLGDTKMFLRSLAGAIFGQGCEQ